jgi:hypothetical protein
MAIVKWGMWTRLVDRRAPGAVWCACSFTTGTCCVFPSDLFDDLHRERCDLHSEGTWSRKLLLACGVELLPRRCQVGEPFLLLVPSCNPLLDFAITRTCH